MVQQQHYSPLRYPGGKVSLYDFLKKVIQKNNIIDGVYAEAFAGGAGAALKLLIMEDVREIYLNDADELLFKFWKSVLYETESLIRLIHDTKITIDEWEYRKSILKDSQNLSDVELGFTAFFLNRCNRSGILKAGVIGGKDQKGDWKLDARYNQNDLIKRIEKIAFYKERIHLSNIDAIQFLKKIKKTKHSELITYLDPPYVIQGKELYRYFYNEKDHIRLARFLQTQMNNYWLTSYDDHPLVHKIYKEVPKNVFHFNYYVNQTKIGRELVISSKNCRMPDEYFQYSKKKLVENGMLMQAI